MVKLKNVSFYKKQNEGAPEKRGVEPEGMMEVELREVISDKSTGTGNVTKPKLICRLMSLKLVLVATVAFALAACISLTLYISFLTNCKIGSDREVNVTEYVLSEKLNTTLKSYNGSVHARLHCKHKRHAPYNPDIPNFKTRKNTSTISQSSDLWEQITNKNLEKLNSYPSVDDLARDNERLSDDSLDATDLTLFNDNSLPIIESNAQDFSTFSVQKADTTVITTESASLSSISKFKNIMTFESSEIVDTATSSLSVEESAPNHDTSESEDSSSSFENNVNISQEVAGGIDLSTRGFSSYDMNSMTTSPDRSQTSLHFSITESESFNKSFETENKTVEDLGLSTEILTTQSGINTMTDTDNLNVFNTDKSVAGLNWSITEFQTSNSSLGSTDKTNQWITDNTVPPTETLTKSNEANIMTAESSIDINDFNMLKTGSHFPTSEWITNSVDSSTHDHDLDAMEITNSAVTVASDSLHSTSDLSLTETVFRFISKASDRITASVESTHSHSLDTTTITSTIEPVDSHMFKDSLDFSKIVTETSGFGSTDKGSIYSSTYDHELDTLPTTNIAYTTDLHMLNTSSDSPIIEAESSSFATTHKVDQWITDNIGMSSSEHYLDTTTATNTNVTADSFSLNTSADFSLAEISTSNKASKSINDSFINNHNLNIMTATNALGVEDKLTNGLNSATTESETSSSIFGSVDEISKSITDSTEPFTLLFTTNRNVNSMTAADTLDAIDFNKLDNSSSSATSKSETDEWITDRASLFTQLLTTSGDVDTLTAADDLDRIDFDWSEGSLSLPIRETKTFSGATDITPWIADGTTLSTQVLTTSRDIDKTTSKNTIDDSDKLQNNMETFGTKLKTFTGNIREEMTESIGLITEVTATNRLNAVGDDITESSSSLPMTETEASGFNSGRIHDGITQRMTDFLSAELSTTNPDINLIASSNILDTSSDILDISSVPLTTELGTPNSNSIHTVETTQDINYSVNLSSQSFTTNYNNDTTAPTNPAFNQWTDIIVTETSQVSTPTGNNILHTTEKSRFEMRQNETNDDENSENVLDDFGSQTKSSLATTDIQLSEATRKIINHDKLLNHKIRSDVGTFTINKEADETNDLANLIYSKETAANHSLFLSNASTTTESINLTDKTNQVNPFDAFISNIDLTDLIPDDYEEIGGNNENPGLISSLLYSFLTSSPFRILTFGDNEKAGISRKAASNEERSDFQFGDSTTTLTTPTNSYLNGISESIYDATKSSTADRIDATGPLRIRLSGEDVNIFQNRELSTTTKSAQIDQANVSNLKPQYLNENRPLSIDPKSFPKSVCQPISKKSDSFSFHNPISAYPNIFKQFQISLAIPQNGMSLPREAQRYVCKPVYASLRAPKKVDNLKLDALEENDDEEDSHIGPSYAEEILGNKSRSARDCPFTERKCEDDSKCIRTHQFCDGEVDCRDASDEAYCPCKFRIGKSRLCDGYDDCPGGEDELKCFGCDEGMFSCDDWSLRDREATCIPMEERCDGIAQCPTRNDERGCSMLKENFSATQHFMVSTTSGYLHKNYKGRWYPVCKNPELWASEVCNVEAGPSVEPPLTHSVPVKTAYKGLYASATAKGTTRLVETCDGAAVYVECPPLLCGMRKKLRNPFRMAEVDTSAEEILSEFHKEGKVSGSGEIVKDSILGDSRVVGGKPSQPEAWPWVVSMYRNGIFHCGGALINELWIITAAHCIDKYWHYYYQIQAGVLRRYSYAPMVQRRKVLLVYEHRLYDRSKLKNDLALMKVEKPFIFNQYIRPICLPSELTAGKDFMWGPEPGTMCTAVGWGAMAEHGSDPDHLREVEVPILKRCKHREDREGREICAGYAEGGKDACQGDSGGPFMCRNPNVPNQWYLLGIVSHGEGCARPDEPGVYTRVSLFLDWIFDIMKSDTHPLRIPLHRCPGYMCKKTKKCISNKRKCNRVIDCFLGDDELDCEKSSFDNIFKHAMRHMFFSFGPERSEHDNDTVGVSVVKAFENDSVAVPENGTGKTHFSRFVCETMLQVIDISKKCDGRVDCEDATDEENCLCSIHLKNKHPEAICDGVTDCLDGSDEEHCNSCKETEFYCRLSRKCIPISKRCDNQFDCKLGEDEADCFLLANSKTVTLDHDKRPYLNSSGFVSFLYGDNWKIVCGNWTDNVASLAADVCSYLDFSDYKHFYKIPLSNNSLQVIYRGKTIPSIESAPSNDRCMGLFLKCSDKIDIDVGKLAHENTTSSIRPIPWNADIYFNGDFKCTGVVFNSEWVMTSSKCVKGDFRLHENYVAVLLGKQKSYINIVSPHEQIHNVVEAIKVSDSNIVLLRLKSAISFSRYIRPLQFDVSDYSLNEKHACLAVGRDLSNHTLTVLLEPSNNCSGAFRCFKRANPTGASCQDRISVEWSGVIACQSRDGWYAAAEFQDPNGYCGFNSNAPYTNIQKWKATIAKLLKQTPYIVNPPFCGGFRCSLGQCIEKLKVCDGIGDCHDSLDENAAFCKEYKRRCELSSDCSCAKSELKCHNGKCVPKVAFCDKVNDCEDWSDEPDACTCGSYLNLTNPHRVCDGVRNCYDRTDEDPKICSCKPNSFKCDGTRYCVASDMVCDGTPDCPNGADEAHCMGLVSVGGSPTNEVQIRSGGVWHPGCFPKQLSTLQLEDICKKLGFAGGSAVRLNVNNTLGKATTWQPVTDPFVGVVVHQKQQNSLVLAMRLGDQPYVKLVTNPNCYRLYLNCI